MSEIDGRLSGWHEAAAADLLSLRSSTREALSEMKVMLGWLFSVRRLCLPNASTNEEETYVRRKQPTSSEGSHRPEGDSEANCLPEQSYGLGYRTSLTLTQAAVMSRVLSTYDVARSVKLVFF